MQFIQFNVLSKRTSYPIYRPIQEDVLSYLTSYPWGRPILFNVLSRRKSVHQRRSNLKPKIANRKA